MNQNSTDRITEIIIHQLQGNITREEMLELRSWMDESPLNEEAVAEFLDESTLQAGIRDMYHYHKKVWEKVQQQVSIPKVVPFRRPVWRRYAAAAILVFLVGGYFLFINKPAEQNELAGTKQVRLQNDVNPGAYKARLTLADGRTIVLDSATAGELAKQGNTSVVYENGQLVYNPSTKEEKILYNTVSTAKGETYAMTLADGSKVWLNSGSSIRFPVTFPGNERRIETTGEVYVKVAKNAKQPFIASCSGLEVLALGTEFNINAYADEANPSATLVEGSVKVNARVSLKPGEQTQLLSNGELTAAKEINLEEVTSWKDGWFHFDNADLKTILRQFARWYDVEVIYEGPVKNRKFLAIVKRSSTLKSVLEMLQDNEIDYRIEGKKLIVKQG